MKVGLPGVGIGGVYYILLVAWMPIRELWLAWHGRSSARRWRLIAFQTALAAAIVAGLAMEWWTFTRLPAILTAAWHFVGLDGILVVTDAPAISDAFPAAASISPDTLPAKGGISLEYLAPAIAAAPFLIIGMIFLSLWLARLAMRSAATSPGISLALQQSAATQLPDTRAAPVRQTVTTGIEAVGGSP
jgi:hypothetical protein